MEATSPTKRRVLGSLDPNASPRPARLDAKQITANAPASPLKKVAVFSASPSQQIETNKRPLLFGELTSADRLHPAKKLCQEASRQAMASHENSNERLTFNVNTAFERSQTASPEPSGVFDTSVVDISQATTFTEPDVVAVTAAATAAVSTLAPLARPPTRPRLTREQAREKAEILKVRLGLASYKLRTGQADIPLEQLELQSASKRHQRSSSSSRPNATGWASSKLQAQLQLQRAQLAASAGAPPRSSLGQQSAALSGPRTLPAGAPAGRAGSDEGVDADRSFSSQIQWSQETADSQGLPTAEDRQGLGAADAGGRLQVEQDQPSWAQSQPVSTPRRHFGVEVEEERLTSSALRGGAASGLLSLAQARS